MENVPILSYVRLIKRFSMIGAVASMGYMLFFLMVTFQSRVAEPPQALRIPNPFEQSIAAQFDLKPFEAVEPVLRSRNVFSSTTTSSADMAQLAQGQLPGNLKVVAVVIGKPSEVVIEDTTARQTYFIREGAPSGGIGIASVSPGRIVIDYQGQSVTIPVRASGSGNSPAGAAF